MRFLLSVSTPLADRHPIAFASILLQNATVTDDQDTKPSPPDLSTQPLRFLAAYWTVWQTLTQQVDQQLNAELALDLRAFIALSYIQAGTTPGDLAHILSVPKYEVARTLKRLEKLQAISRRPAPHNARYHELSVTPHGRALWCDALAIVQSLTAPLLEPLGGQLDVVTRALEQVARAHSSRSLYEQQ